MTRTFYNLCSDSRPFSYVDHDWYDVDTTFQLPSCPAGSTAVGKDYSPGIHKLYGFKVELLGTSIGSDLFAKGTEKEPVPVYDLELVCENYGFHDEKLKTFVVNVTISYEI